MSTTTLRRFSFCFVPLLVVMATGTVSAQQELRIGVFNAQRVWDESEEGKRLQARLNTFRDQKQEEIRSKESDLTEKQNQLTTQALSLSSEKRSTLEKEIQRGILELNQMRESAAQEMQLEVAEAQDTFQAKLLSIVPQIGRDEGFTVILEYNAVIFASPTIDITSAVVDRVDRVFGSSAEKPDATE